MDSIAQSPSTPEAEVLYKVLNEDGSTHHHLGFQWDLPHDGQPGAWTPEIKGRLEPCANGYHLCRLSDLVNWVGPAIFTAEYRGERIDENTRGESKVVVSQARLLARVETWNESTARLFACDCAERTLLRQRERGFEPEPVFWETIEVARRYARGEATRQELDAAWDADRDAARDAAWDAEHTWQVNRLQWYLAGQPVEVPA